MKTFDLSEILNHLIEAYRKIRNTCRFLLSNLCDFDPARSIACRSNSCLNWTAGAHAGSTTLFRACGRGYDEFEFHTIFHALNNFVQSI